MTLIRSAAVAAFVLAACSGDRLDRTNPGTNQADEPTETFDRLVAAVSAPDVIVNSFTQGFAESEVTVRDVSGEEAGQEPAIGELTFKLLTEHSKKDEFESQSFAEAIASNNFVFRSGDGGACSEVTTMLRDWLIPEVADEVQTIFEGDELAPTFCARLLLTGIDGGSEFLVLQERLIERALVIEVFGRD